MNGDLDYHDNYNKYYSKKRGSDAYLYESKKWDDLRLELGLIQGFSWAFTFLWSLVIPLIPTIAWLFVLFLPTIFGINFLMMIYYEYKGYIAFHNSIIVEFVLQAIFTAFSFCFQLLILITLAEMFNPIVLEGW